MITIAGSVIYKIALARNSLGQVPLSFEAFSIASMHIFRNVEFTGKDGEFVIFDDLENSQRLLSVLFGEKFYITETKVSFENIIYFSKDYILYIDAFKDDMIVGSFNEDSIIIQTLKE